MTDEIVLQMDDCEFDPNADAAAWQPGSDDQHERRGDKPRKGGRQKEKKTKYDRANPEFEDFPGYEGSGFHANMEFAPPAYMIQAQSEAPPPMPFTDTAKLSEDECRKALEEYVASEMCYGSKPAKDMTITETMGVTAFHYKLETFTENRKTKKKKKPYKGGHVDGPENGPPPQPWEISCPPKKFFHSDKVKQEVPHTAKVKKCKECKGRGWETCDDCDGWGKVECDTCDGSGVDGTETDEEGNEHDKQCVWCNGDGEKRCMECMGDGRVICDDCEGYRKLKCFIQLKVKFINHEDSYVLETTDMPDELVKSAGGTMLFEQELPRVWPLASFPVPDINANSQRLVGAHSTSWPNEFIHQQRQTLRGIPVTEVHYKWEDFSSRFWVYGTERKVYAPDYPQQCCCGCTVL